MCTNRERNFSEIEMDNKGSKKNIRNNEKRAVMSAFLCNCERPTILSQLERKMTLRKLKFGSTTER